MGKEVAALMQRKKNEQSKPQEPPKTVKLEDPLCTLKKLPPHSLIGVETAINPKKVDGDKKKYKV